MLNFDEFAAVKKRQRGAAAAATSTGEAAPSSSIASAGASGETKEVSQSPTAAASSTPRATSLDALKNDSSSSSSSSSSSGKPKKAAADKGPAGSANSSKTSKAEAQSALGVVQAGLRHTWSTIVGVVENNELQSAYVVLLLLDTFSALLIVLVHFGTLLQDLREAGMAAGASDGTAAGPGPTVTMMGDDPTSPSPMFSSFAAVNGALGLIGRLFASVFTLPGGFHHPAITAVLLPVLHSFCSFALLLFFVEIALVVVAFGAATLRHVGYAVDLAVVCAQVYEELKVIQPLTGHTSTPAIAAAAAAASSSNTGAAAAGASLGLGVCAVSFRVFNLLRCWRLVRLYAAFIAVEVNKHSVTKKALEDKVKDCKVLEIDRYKLQNDLRKEKESLVAVESMLTNYKEEVGTLNEALKIAAMDIAEIAQTEEDEDDLGAGDDEDDEVLRGLDSVSEAEAMARLQAALSEPVRGGQGQGQGQGARRGHTHSHGPGTRNVDELYKQLRTDNSGSGGAGGGSGTKKSPSAGRGGGGSGGATMVVKDDGSFATQA